MMPSSDPSSEIPVQDPLPPKMKGVGARLRRYFLAGILVTAPIGVSIYLTWLFVTWVDSKVNPLIPDKYNPESYLPFGIPGLGVIVVIVALTLVGWLTANFFGRFFLRLSERIMQRMPVVRTIYGALKQVLETVLAQQGESFREVVLVQYPSQGIWSLGFISGRTRGEIQRIMPEEMVNVFIPTTPNPTSGFLLFFPRKDVIVLKMTVEEAMKKVISAGIVTPVERE